MITGVDIEKVEAEDPRTRENLQKSVQLAIDISTKSQEEYASQSLKREEQKNIVRNQIICSIHPNRENY